MELVDVADSKSAGGDTVWVRVPPPAPAQKFPPSLRFRLRRKLRYGGNFFAFGPDSPRWIRGRGETGRWTGSWIFFVKNRQRERQALPVSLFGAAAFAVGKDRPLRCVD